MPRPTLPAAIVLLSALGCAARAPADPATPDLPRFVNRSEGVPRGRSDSTDAYTRLRATSPDPAYGYSQERPVKVGGARDRTDGRASLYLNGLRGPGGEPIRYERLGTCCYFTPRDASFGAIGLLNVYRLTVDGQPKPVLLYIDIYDTDPALVPVGLTARP